MNRIIVMSFIFIFYGCGDSSDAKISTIYSYEYMWNINADSYYHRSGQALRGSDINLANTWDSVQGEGVIVAVIDDGFDAYHNDLKDNIYLTYDVNSNSSDVVSPRGLTHGIKVAGVIAAVDNDFGLVGVAPKVKLILIQVNLKSLNTAELIEAFEYAKDNGAKVINCSWGNGSLSQPLADKLDDIKNSGIITIFASGNDKYNLDDAGKEDESEYESVIGVGASDERNELASYSNYGSNIDIYAPGGDGLGLNLLAFNSGYTQAVGTSFAAPTISAVVALFLSYNANLTFDQIRDSLIQQSDTTIDGFDKINVSNSFSQIKGY
jgi:subtilisin family serine protease